MSHQKWNMYIIKKQMISHVKNLKYIEKRIIVAIKKNDINDIDYLTTALIKDINEIRKHYELNKEQNNVKTYKRNDR